MWKIYFPLVYNRPLSRGHPDGLISWNSALRYDETSVRSVIANTAHDVVVAILLHHSLAFYVYLRYIFISCASVAHNISSTIFDRCILYIYHICCSILFYRNHGTLSLTQLTSEVMLPFSIIILEISFPFLNEILSLTSHRLFFTLSFKNSFAYPIFDGN